MPAAGPPDDRCLRSLLPRGIEPQAAAVWECSQGWRYQGRQDGAHLENPELAVSGPPGGLVVVAGRCRQPAHCQIVKPHGVHIEFAPVAIG